MQQLQKLISTITFCRNKFQNFDQKKDIEIVLGSYRIILLVGGSTAFSQGIILHCDQSLG